MNWVGSICLECFGTGELHCEFGAVDAGPDDYGLDRDKGFPAWPCPECKGSGIEIRPLNLIFFLQGRIH